MKTMKRLCAIIATVMMMLVLPMEGMAETPYEGYIWNTEGRDVHSINGYVYHDSIDGAFLPTGVFNNPEDIFIANDDTIYITDTGNNRIVHLDQDYEVIKVIGDQDGPGKLNGPKGVFIKEDGTVYVADTKNQRIAIFDQNGKYERELTAPTSTLLGKKFSYSPSKLVVDKRDYLYVVSEGNTKGLMQINNKGEFKGFFGTNEVGFNLWRFLARLIATDEQKAKMRSVQPLAFSNLAQDEDGFIYTTTLGTDENQIKRLSPVGVDTLNPSAKKYGDLLSYGGNIEISAFIDLTVNEDGLITALNLQTSRIYQYDKLGNLLFVFGGTGEQNGVFTTPSSIDQDSEGILYVVDKGRNRIDLFRTTPFADLVHTASKLYVDGQYEDAKEIWEEVIHLNGNYDIAYHAIGKALYKSEKYKEAMDYFKKASSRTDYSASFREYRVEYVREHFAWFFGGVIALFIILRFGIPRLIKLIRQGRKERRTALEGEVDAK
ncbi:DNA-binding beta-propeller fold protein YncE [Lederbergia wuyishanensis]|uniref:DNA-binding beta-propeller fold protein YncE n=2 Tax=Lederbergia wuyishanensis TaxID=1347903 RepID=A0ABU0D9L7_9BACI|nr:DNA-binding beta-propeller fold protein YncE [Lederbergia wuyishanensis]